MVAAVLILLLIAVLFGLGLAVAAAKVLLWLALALFVLWVIGRFIGAGSTAGSSRRGWYAW